MSTVRKASRQRAKLRLGVVGPAGAGKTMGALVLAYGITGDWSKIGLADTERGSGELYVGQRVPGTGLVIGEFLYAPLSEPYEVRKYMEAHADLIEAECDVVILDSISHAWAGAGGLLDKQGKIASGGKESGYTAWRHITPEHNAFIDMMLGSPAHIVATMRSKVEYVLETNDKGKQVPRKVGMAPVQREGMDYEFTVVLDVDQDSHTAHASKDRTTLFHDTYFKITPDVGKQLMTWLNTGADPVRVVPPPSEPVEDKARAGAELLASRFVAASSDIALTALSADKTILKQRDWLKEHRPDLSAQLEETVAAAFERVSSPLGDALGMPEASEAA